MPDDLLPNKTLLYVGEPMQTILVQHCHGLSRFYFGAGPKCTHTICKELKQDLYQNLEVTAQDKEKDKAQSWQTLKQEHVATFVLWEFFYHIICRRVPINMVNWNKSEKKTI